MTPSITAWPPMARSSWRGSQGPGGGGVWLQRHGIALGRSSVGSASRRTARAAAARHGPSRRGKAERVPAGLSPAPSRAVAASTVARTGSAPPVLRLRLLAVIGPRVAPAEALHAAGRIDDLLLAREERVAARADFDVDLRLGRPRLDHVAAQAGDRRSRRTWDGCPVFMSGCLSLSVPPALRSPQRKQGIAAGQGLFSRPPSFGRDQVFMAPRNWALFLVLPSLSSRNSIASTGL